RKRNSLFDDDHTEDLLDVLGFDTNNNNSKKKEQASWLKSDRAGPRQRVRTRVDDILENLNSTHPSERPETGEKDPLVEQKQREKSIPGKESALQEDLTFGSYQPSLGPRLRGQQPSRPSLTSERFSSEEPNFGFLEKKPKPAPSSRDRRASDWLGLKSDDNCPAADAPNTKTPAESSLLERRASSADNHVTPAEAVEASVPTDVAVNETKQQASKSQPKEEDKDDWLTGALRRKALSEAPLLERRLSSADSHAGFAPATEPSPAQTENTINYKQLWCGGLSLVGFHRQSSRAARPRHFLHRRKGNRSRFADFLPIGSSFQSAAQLNQEKTSATAVQQQMTPLQSQRGHTEPDSLQRVRERTQQPGNDRALQARVIQLEGQVQNQGTFTTAVFLSNTNSLTLLCVVAQVKTLELAQEQSQMLLENVQMKHKQDMELMENTYKTKIKWLEESAAQRETLARQECEDLRGRLSEQQAEYQRKLDQAKQDRDQEVAQLRDVHRKTVSEMRKDHEDQIQHLKQLKNDEINVVKNATSQTRSLTVVTEQMEQFSSHLGELCSFSVMQDRLSEQQKAAVEERAFLKDIISRMHTQLREQERQLEKERWKATAEEAKVESAQRGLEEERRALSKEREELEKAKRAVQEEQMSMMEHCAAERRRLDAEWASFHSAEKQRQEQVEKVSSLLEKRENAIITLANEQAELKLQTAELKQKENALAQERESLKRLQEELESSKKKISSMESRLSTQIQEVEVLRKLALQKYRNGESALQEAKSMEAEQKARLTDMLGQKELPWKREQHVLQEHMRISR
uniref:Fas-binding factor 1 C-terminal domain-containing protein n=1 Tax=Tetraodon nigroviridis TaxID=99883 RepID=H3D214_TETNG